MPEHGHRIGQVPVQLIAKPSQLGQGVQVPGPDSADEAAQDAPRELYVLGVLDLPPAPRWCSG